MFYKITISWISDGSITCDKLATLEVVGVTDVVIAEASDTLVVEGLDVATDVCVELKASIGSFKHLLNKFIQR